MCPERRARSTLTMRRIVVVREAPDGEDLDAANDVVLVEDDGIAREVARLIARRLGVAVPAPRERSAPAVVALPKPEDRP